MTLLYGIFPLYIYLSNENCSWKKKRKCSYNYNILVRARLLLIVEKLFLRNKKIFIQFISEGLGYVIQLEIPCMRCSAI